MPTFLLTVTDEVGKRDTMSVSAETAQEAVALLESQGCTDITLHTEDAGAVFTSVEVLEGGDITAADIVEFRSMSDGAFFWWVTAMLYKKAWWLMVIALALLAINWLLSDGFGLTFFLACGLFLFPLAIAFWSTFTGFARRYNRMLECFAWARWEQVLEQIPALRGSVPEFELDGREAGALAGLGRLDEALALTKKHADSEEIPRWMYYGRVAEVLDVAKQHEEAMRRHQLALDDAPENPTAQLDLAMSLLANEAEPDLARRLIEQAQQQHLSDVLQLVLPGIEGLLALNEGRFTEAVPLFHQLDAGLRPLLPGSPLIGVFLDAGQGYLAITYAHLNEHEKAERHMQLALPRLRALKSNRILDRYPIQAEAR